jgi:hypothetical protein
MRRDADHPHHHRDVLGLHARRARVHRGGDEVDAAEQERHELERHRSSHSDEPERA